MFVVPTKRGGFEIRESRSTPAGPRSRTLVTFRELSDEVIEKANARATKPLDPDRLREAALRAGAPLAQTAADRAARELIAELGRGREPEPKLGRLLMTMLGDDSKAATAPADPTRAVAGWMAATPEERGRNLVDLLLLADALPASGRRDEQPHFPRLDRSPA
jgi:hypothetical protein